MCCWNHNNFITVIMEKELKIVSPLDGRYSEKISPLSRTCSEFEIMKRKVMIEVEYFVFLVSNFSGFNGFRKLLIENVHFEKDEIRKIKMIYQKFDQEDFDFINEIEKNDTRHDIKAIENFVKIKLRSLEFVKEDLIDYVHFGLTSQDVVSFANVSITYGVAVIIERKINDVKNAMKNIYDSENHHIFLARTHGQFAIPTSFKREMDSYIERLRLISYKENISTPFSCKFGGAIGNLASIKFISRSKGENCELVDDMFSEFIKSNGFYSSEHTSQVDNYRGITPLMHQYSQYAGILIDFCRDIWQYFSLGYFISDVEKGYCGSSTMPHKINPIKFENAEGCLEKVENDMNFFSSKLSKSRLQRDLTDSVTIRMIYESFCYFYLALCNIEEGLSKIKVNDDVLEKEMYVNYQILSEPVQLILKDYGFHDGYEKSKKLFQGLITCDKRKYERLIDKLEIENQELYDLLYDLTPKDYYYE